MSISARLNSYFGVGLLLVVCLSQASPECPDVQPAHSTSKAARYFPLDAFEEPSIGIPPSVSDCFVERIAAARLRPECKSESQKTLAQTAAGRALSHLLLTPIEEISFTELIDRLHVADSQDLWILVLSALMLGPPIFVDELDNERLRSRAPSDPMTAMYYVEVLRLLSHEPERWESVASEIVMENPSLLTSGRLSKLNYRVDICRMREWLPEQPGDFLDTLITRAEAGQLRGIGALIEPDRVSPLSVMRIVNASHPNWRGLSGSWRGHLEENLGDWVNLGMPETLASSDSWGLEQRAAMREPGELLEEVKWFLVSQNRISASRYLALLDLHVSPAVRRWTAAMQFALIPSRAAFDKMIDRGIKPELVAHEAEADQIEAVVVGASGEQLSPALTKFISSLPCDIFRAGDDPPFDARADSADSALGKWGERAEECR